MPSPVDGVLNVVVPVILVITVTVVPLDLVDGLSVRDEVGVPDDSN